MLNGDCGMVDYQSSWEEQFAELPLELRHEFEEFVFGPIVRFMCTTFLALIRGVGHRYTQIYSEIRKGPGEYFRVAGLVIP